MCPNVKKIVVNPKTSASKKYPLQLLSELAGAVLDQDTGELLEYRHLLKNPRYKNDWEKHTQKK